MFFFFFFAGWPLHCVPEGPWPQQALPSEKLSRDPGDRPAKVFMFGGPDRALQETSNLQARD